MGEEEVKDQKTAISGSEPGKDGKVPGAEPGKKEGEVVAGQPSAGDDALPFDKHPKWQAARKAEKALQELMTANEIESIEDLVTLVVTGKEVKGKQVNIDQLDTLIKKASKLDQYEAYWQQQEEEKRRAAEDPAETIARLEKKLKDLTEGEKNKELQTQKANEAKQLWAAYDSEVSKIFQTMEDLPPEVQKACTLFMGVDNPASNVNFTDKKAIKAAAQEARKAVEGIMDFAIKQYIAGKREIPKVPGAASAAAQTPVIKNLRDARRIMAEQVSKLPHT